MLKNYNIIIIFLTFCINNVLANNQLCSRTARINQQEVLVDAGSTKKGEGLRFFLEKDPISKEYLQKYQDSSAPKWTSAALGTMGTILLILGLAKNNTTNEKKKQKQIFLVGGASLFALNFLIMRTMDFHNETYLQRAIDEYNKRNSPKIYFSPILNKNKNKPLGAAIGVIKSF